MALHKENYDRDCKKKILTREKPAPKCEWISMEIVQDIERKRLLRNKTDEESNR